MFDNWEPTNEHRQEFKQGIKTKQMEYDYDVMIKKIVNVLYYFTKPSSYTRKTETGWACPYGDSWLQRKDIQKEIDLDISAPLFRKLIQIYRENPEKYNPMGNGDRPIPGFIVASKAGYKFERKDWKKIELYLKSMDERRRSLNKQILSAEQQIDNIKNFNKWQAGEVKYEKGRGEYD